MKYFMIAALGFILSTGMVMDVYAEENNNGVPKVDNLSMETKGHVKVSVPQEFLKHDGNNLQLIVKLKIEEGWHVNTHPASLDFLIPTSIDVRDDYGKAEVTNITWPKSGNIPTPLGEITVFGGDINIPVEASLPENAKEIRVLIRAQACNNTGTCLRPSDWVVLLTVL